jgi:ribonuclease HI
LTETIQDVCARLGIDDWDLLLVGDGSGSRWGYQMGWACVAMERDSFDRRVFYGGANDGTVNFAEMMAYLAPLAWYLNKVTIGRREDKTAYSVKNVHIITDSEHVETKGNAAASVTSPANTVLWAAFELINRQGIRLHWHHVKRETVGLNVFCDVLSKAGRHLIQDVQSLELIDTQHGLHPQNVNPWE